MSEERLTPEERLSRPGAILDAHYEVERKLGSGGMGKVVAARRLDTGERVAIKLMHPRFAEDRELVIRFQREARATDRLKSEHVRRVLGTGEIPDRAPFLVMEYLEGEDLKALVKRDGPLSPRLAATYVSQACSALAEAHALGIVHRDLKPANLFLADREGGEPIIKVMDFGVAKFDSPNVAGDALDVTGTRGFVGSPQFMAPEQITHPQKVSALADVWALGAILHYLLSGKAPFAAEDRGDEIFKVLGEPPHPLPEAPPKLAEIVLRCLEKSPESRYPNVTALARELVPFLRDAAADEEVRSERVPKQFSRTLRLHAEDVPKGPPPEPATEMEEASTLEAEEPSTVENEDTAMASVRFLAAPPRVRPRLFVLGWAAAAIAGGALAALVVGTKPPETQAAASGPPAATAVPFASAPASAAPADLPPPPATVVVAAMAAPSESTRVLPLPRPSPPPAAKPAASAAPKGQKPLFEMPEEKSPPRPRPKPDSPYE